jgi:hypothetical protein
MAYTTLNKWWLVAAGLSFGMAAPGLSAVMAVVLSAASLVVPFGTLVWVTRMHLVLPFLNETHRNAGSPSAAFAAGLFYVTMRMTTSMRYAAVISLIMMGCIAVMRPESSLLVYASAHKYALACAFGTLFDVEMWLTGLFWYDVFAMALAWSLVERIRTLDGVWANGVQQSTEARTMITKWLNQQLERHRPAIDKARAWATEQAIVAYRTTTEALRQRYRSTVIDVASNNQSPVQPPPLVEIVDVSVPVIDPSVVTNQGAAPSMCHKWLDGENRFCKRRPRMDTGYCAVHG